MMDNKEAMQEAMKMAASPTGQQLLNLLRSSDSEQLNQAMQMAASGNYEGAKQILNQMLQDPQAKAILTRMGGNHGTNGR